MKSYPLIILGAGASFDFIEINSFHPIGFQDTDLLKYRPPLVKEIFDTKRFYEYLKSYPEASRLAADFNGISDFEGYLTKVQNEFAPSNKDRYRQLISLRLYLRDLFWTISDKYFKEVNNYGKLINMINDRGGNACFVNFNYDLLLEKSIPEAGFNIDINSYVAGPIKIFKIHGACNWFYEADFIEGHRGNPTAYKHFMSFADNLIKDYLDKDRDDKKPMIIDRGTEFRFEADNTSNRVGTSYYLPALAIPITTKANYVCPDEHITYLEDALKNIDRILIIGWRGNDEYLISLLKDKIKNPMPVTIVSKTSSTLVKDKIYMNKNLTIKILDIGFSQFINGEQVENFFS